MVARATAGGTIGSGPSINGKGAVAYTATVSGGTGAFVTDGVTPRRNIALHLVSADRDFGSTVRINNATAP